MEEQVTLEPELEEALAHATDAEMCDIAGGQLWAVELGRSGSRGREHGMGLVGCGCFEKASGSAF